MNLFSDIESGAVISDCSQYRYRLWRCWNPDGNMLVFCGLNPSVADHNINDPTIRRMMGFAKQWAYDGIVVVNLFALRSTNPASLRRVDDPIGPENDAAIIDACRGRDVVVAWGGHTMTKTRDKTVLKLLSEAKSIRCLGVNKDGSPVHPLYLPGKTELRNYP